MWNLNDFTDMLHNAHLHFVKHKWWQITVHLFGRKAIASIACRMCQTTFSKAVVESAYREKVTTRSSIRKVDDHRVSQSRSNCRTGTGSGLPLESVQDPASLLSRIVSSKSSRRWPHEAPQAVTSFLTVPIMSAVSVVRYSSIVIPSGRGIIRSSSSVGFGSGPTGTESRHLSRSWVLNRSLALQDWWRVGTSSYLVLTRPIGSDACGDVKPRRRPISGLLSDRYQLMHNLLTSDIARHSRRL